jgi:hypothetical protein
LSFWKLINHQRKTASSLANRMLLENLCVFYRDSVYFKGKQYFFIGKCPGKRGFTILPTKGTRT